MQLEIEHHIKNLCKKNCKGICPQCGVNLNNKECACSEKFSDERWKPLYKNEIINNGELKWHYQNEDRQKQEDVNVGLIGKQKHLNCPAALNVTRQNYLIVPVPTVATIGVGR